MAIRRSMCLTALIVAAASFAAQPGAAAPTSCTKPVSVGAQTTAECLFASVGERVAVRGATSAVGMFVSNYVPYPAMTGITVSVLDRSGNTVASCSASSYTVAVCSSLERVSVPAGAMLRCRIRAWADADLGLGRGVVSCGGR